MAVTESNHKILRYKLIYNDEAISSKNKEQTLPSKIKLGPSLCENCSNRSVI